MDHLPLYPSKKIRRLHDRSRIGGYILIRHQTHVTVTMEGLPLHEDFSYRMTTPRRREMASKSDDTMVPPVANSSQRLAVARRAELHDTSSMTLLGSLASAIQSHLTEEIRFFPVVNFGQ